eukprot:COSAG04_NODE_15646_length_525_cov_0.730047_1_plen_23_part_01
MRRRLVRPFGGCLRRCRRLLKAR